MCTEYMSIRIKLSIISGAEFVKLQIWLQTELDNMKLCYQLIITITEFSNLKKTRNNNIIKIAFGSIILILVKTIYCVQLPIAINLCMLCA